MSNSPNQLSFLPDDYLARKAQRRANILCASLAIIVMTMIVTAFVWTERQQKRLLQQRDVVQRDYTDAARRIEQVKQMQEKQRKMAHQAELTASLLDKVPRSFLLAEITNSMPAGVSLLNLTLDSKKRSPSGSTDKSAPKPSFSKRKTKTADDDSDKDSAPGAKPAGPAAPIATQYDVTMHITGICNTDVQVAHLMYKLNGSKLLKDVNLVITDEDTIGDEKVRRFQIEMTLNPEAEVFIPDGKQQVVNVEVGG